MNISVTARNLEVDDKVRKYVGKRLQKLEKLYKRIYKCDVILDAEKERKSVEILIYLKRTRIVAKETSPDIFASIDLASEKVKKQLRRLNDRVSSRRSRKTVFSRFMNSIPRKNKRTVEDIGDPENYDETVKYEDFADRSVAPDESRTEPETNKIDFIMFKNSKTGESNVLNSGKDEIGPGF